MALTHSGDTDDDQTEALRALNDELRQNLTIGTALMTADVAGADGLAAVRSRIAAYCDTRHLALQLIEP